jgi:hypothetical protein
MVMRSLGLKIRACVALACLAGAGCGNFEVQSVVLDLRILSMTVSPPEVVVPLEAAQDPMNLPEVSVQVCALIADPVDSRDIEYRMTACWPTEESYRCDEPGRAEVLLTGPPNEPFARVTDPEESDEPVEVCATLSSNVVLPALILDQIEVEGSYEDVAAQVIGNGGNLDVQVELAVRGVGQGPEDLQYGSKRVRYALPLPEGRVANNNPAIQALYATVDPDEDDDDDDDEDGVEMPQGRCIDVDAPLVVAPGTEIEFEPVPADGSFETYDVPTFDGRTRRFTENLVYTWYATHTAWEPEQTGGPRNVATGQPAVPSSVWTAPRNPDTIGDGLDVPIWVVQRDERGGQSWFESCVRVVP